MFKLAVEGATLRIGVLNHGQLSKTTRKLQADDGWGLVVLYDWLT